MAAHREDDLTLSRSDLADDPFESTNLADSKPDQLRSSMKGLIAGLKNYQAQYPVDKADGTTPVMPTLP